MDIERETDKETDTERYREPDTKRLREKKTRLRDLVCDTDQK